MNYLEQFRFLCLVDEQTFSLVFVAFVVFSCLTIHTKKMTSVSSFVYARYACIQRLLRFLQYASVLYLINLI